MKSTIALTIVLLGMSALPGISQNYSIKSFTIDSGGGTSTGGRFRVAGTIGQPDAGGILSGGASTQGAPVLNIAFTDASHSAVAVWWPLEDGTYSINGGFWRMPVPVFELEQNSDLNTTNWTKVPQVPSIQGTNKFIVSPSSSGNAFLRLKK